jgi:hypothetical protein
VDVLGLHEDHVAEELAVRALQVELGDVDFVDAEVLREFEVRVSGMSPPFLAAVGGWHIRRSLDRT